MNTLADIILYGNFTDLKAQITRVEHLNFIDEYGFTPLIEAAIINDIDKVQLLIEHGADVNFPDLTGSSALHWAAENNNAELAEFLLIHGADANTYTAASQPVLVKPLLNKESILKKVLMNYGANLTFAKDFINTKMIGHLFELVQSADIVDHQGNFTEVEFEGFFLESTLDLITHSLTDYKKNYAARPLRKTFDKLTLIIQALRNAERLIHYQHHLINFENYQTEIGALINQDPLIIPIAQEGHAITIVRHDNLLAVCDRMKKTDADEKFIIYYMNRPSRLTTELIQSLIYQRQPLDIFHKMLPAELGLQPINILPIPPQKIGNCSWANVEATLPALFFMLSVGNKNDEDPRHAAMRIFHDWRLWEQDRSLHRCIEDFKTANAARKASKASILGAVLFQCCLHGDKKSLTRSQKIIPILKTRGYEYILNNYLEVYYNRKKTKPGIIFKELLEENDRLYT